MLRPLFAALVFSVALAPVARADGLLAPSLNLFPTHIAPTGQFDGGMGLFPKGDLSEDPWDVPVVATQFVAGAAVNVGSLVLFNALAAGTDTMNADEARSRLLTYGLMQFALTPLASDTAIWGVGDAMSEFHTHGWAWPLLANYVVELVAVGARLGVAYGLVETKGDVLVQDASSLLGSYAIVDYLIHGIVVPATVTYFSIRSRTGMSYGFGSNERRAAPPPPALVARVRGTFRSDTDTREKSTREASGDGAVSVSLARLSF